MIEVPIINAEGKEIGKEEIDEQVLGGFVRSALLKEVVLMYENNRRQGTASTKTRGEVKGSTRKRWRQKGTGRARVGSGKVPHFRGGGVAHGPKPREYYYRLPKKAVRLALKSAILAKLKASKVKILDGLQLTVPKTRIVHQLLQKANLTRSCLIVSADFDEALHLATRNLSYANLAPLGELNAREVLRHVNVLFLRDAFVQMKEKYSAETKGVKS